MFDFGLDLLISSIAPLACIKSPKDPCLMINIFFIF